MPSKDATVILEAAKKVKGGNSISEEVAEWFAGILRTHAGKKDGELRLIKRRKSK